MRYFNCQKKKIFELFDQGMIPSQLYDKANVKKHTLFNYYEQWKREQERLAEEADGKRLAKEREEKLRNEKLQKELKLKNEFKIARKGYFEVLGRIGRTENQEVSPELERAHWIAYLKLEEATKKLCPECTDFESIVRKIIFIK